MELGYGLASARSMHNNIRDIGPSERLFDIMWLIGGGKSFTVFI